MRNRKTIRIISGALSLIGLIAPFIADTLNDGLMEEEIEEKIAEILKKKGVVTKNENKSA